jgi:HEPN domain-containing protein
MRAITEEWVLKAEEDFDSAETLLHGREVPINAAACFHCQQCAEKYLKAFLEEHEIEFPRSHELISLLDLCLSKDGDFIVLIKSLRRLESFAVSTRYPGVHIKSKTAEDALKAAERVRRFIRDKLGIK